MSHAKRIEWDSAEGGTYLAPRLLAMRKRVSHGGTEARREEVQGGKGYRGEGVQREERGRKLVLVGGESVILYFG